MKKIFKIAKTELQTLFYSPVAWLVLIVFTCQCALTFASGMMEQANGQAMGFSLWSVTYSLFANSMGGSLFPSVQGYLYLYIPLLTMGLMSREFGSGSIKLLYSSPVTNTQIILGKYLSMLIYGLILMAVLLCFVLFGAFTIKDFDLPMVLSGMLGLYLLLCAYAAIGLFMSSLTSYQVVAAILTLAMLTVLAYVRNWWQDIEFVREITYWLSISGRADELIAGLICSEDVLYFIIVSVLFLSLSIIRLQANRQKSRWTVTFGKYVWVLVGACLLGYLSSRQKLMTYYDTTATKENTLTPNSQEVIAQLDGGLTITTYVNALDVYDIWTALPSAVKYDQQLFRQYIRFKPEIKMEYVYYYDSINDSIQDLQYPGMNAKERMREITRLYNIDSTLFISPEEIRSQIDLLPEGRRFVRLLERESGEKTFLRVYNDMSHHPGEAEMTAAFKRLVMEVPKVGFLVGQGERDISKTGDRDYNFAWDKRYRYALINQGFDVAEVNLDQEIPADINILVIAEMRWGLSEEQHKNLQSYIARGGNLMIMCEPSRADVMKPLLAEFGVSMVPGQLVRVTEDYSPELVLAAPTEQAAELIYQFDEMRKARRLIVTPGAAGLTYTEAGYKVIPLFMTDDIVWNELETTNFIDDTVRLNPTIGEVQQNYTTALALQRNVNGKEQRVLIYGDADCISNGELKMDRVELGASNFNIIMGNFYWLSDNKVPIDVRRPIPTDDEVYLSQESMRVWKVIMTWVMPAILIALYVLLWLRRRGR